MRITGAQLPYRILTTSEFLSLYSVTVGNEEGFRSVARSELQAWLRRYAAGSNTLAPGIHSASSAIFGDLVERETQAEEQASQRNHQAR